MPRSKNDPLKRKCAQALNHQAAAILDVNEVYLTITQNIENLTRVAGEAEIAAIAVGAEPENSPARVEAKEVVDTAHANLERYQVYANDLRQIMLGINATRDHLLLVVDTLWGLDEESIKVYLG